MSGTALQQNALERNNLLMMPSAQVHPGDDITLTYRYNSGLFSSGPPSDANLADFVDVLSKAANFFISGQPARDGNAVSVAIKAKSTVMPMTAEAFFAAVKHVAPGILDRGDYDLMQAVPSILGHQAGAFSPADAAGINANNRAYVSPAHRALSNVGTAVEQGIAKAGAAAQSVTHTFIIIAVLLLIGAGMYFAAPFLKAAGRTVK